MEVSHVIVIAVICLFVFAMSCLFVLYMMKKAAVTALNTVVDKTINKASDLVGQKVLDPTMAVATEGMRKGIDAVGQAVKEEYQDNKRRSPANIDIEVTKLAQQLKGKVTTADVTSQLKLSSKEAKDAFKRLKTAGDCTESSQGHYVVYVFGAFLEKVRVWKCEYCADKVTQDPGDRDCSSCGGKYQVTEEVVG
jgi:rubrerythrin